MKLRSLRIAVESTGGPFEASIPFDDGLVVIRADNTRGKSTCFKAILSALGLEAMLTTSQSEPPLTPAVTDKIQWDGVTHDVIESNVFLEIENTAKERITVQRTIKGERDWHLVTVYDGPVFYAHSSCLCKYSGSSRTTQQKARRLDHAQGELVF